MTVRTKECPKCKEAGHDSKGDHLWLMSDDIMWCCKRTEYHGDGLPYYEKDGEVCTPREESILGGTATTIKVDPLTLPMGKLYIRDINPRVSEKYGVRVATDGTGEITEHYYPLTVKGKLHCYKVRKCAEKDFFTTLSTKGLPVDLFGLPTVVSKKPEHLIITEGELDAMATFQVLSPKYPKLYALSLPQGVNNLMSLKTNMQLLLDCKNLYYYPDQDAPGLASIDAVVALFPHIRIIYTTEKDACEMLKAGKSAELDDAFRNAEKYRPKCIITVLDVCNTAVTPVEMGLSYPYPTLTEKTYGMRTKQLIGIGAGPGTGKSTLIESIQKHIVYEHGQKIAIFALEEDPSWTLKKLVGSVMNQPIHLPGELYDVKEAERIARTFDGKVNFYDSYEYIDWKSIEDAIRYFHSDGVKYFFIDPLSALIAHLNASDGNTFLSNAMYQMSKMVKALDITIFHVNHLNNPPSGKDHGAGGRVHGGQFSGSRAQWKFSTALWGMERDQEAEDDTLRNEVVLRIIKDRMAGANGVVNLTYDKKRGVLVEVPMKALGIGGF